jgi:hypothetical protein
MYRLLNYYGRFESFRGSFSTLPSWARALLFLAALPGILLGALSLLALAVSILTLFLLAVPVYRVLQVLTGAGRAPVVMPEAQPTAPATSAEVVDVPPPGRRRQIDVRIVE